MALREERKKQQNLSVKTSGFKGTRVSAGPPQDLLSVSLSLPIETLATACSCPAPICSSLLVMTDANPGAIFLFPAPLTSSPAL